jgi:chorismate mutase / prephenate dehydratase
MTIIDERVHLEKTRKQIDAIDEKITQLLAQRMNLALKTQKEKHSNGQNVQDANREKNVLEHVETIARQNGLDTNVALRVFEEIMAASKNRQFMNHDPPKKENLKWNTIAFQGERGAYSEEALHAMNPNANPIACKTFSDVFQAVQQGKTDAGLVPIENSTEGSINWTYDLLLDSQLTIVGETFLRVRHHLVGLNDTKIQNGLKVYSHPQALAQCRHFLQKHQLEAVEYYDTAGAAKDIQKGKICGAAIASKSAADHYGLTVLQEGVEDNRNNYTRFILMSKNALAKGDKTSIVFSTQHQAGALFKVMKIFADAEINLTKLESRPTKDTPWEYRFYMDFEGNANVKPFSDAINDMKKHTLFLKILGTYPKEQT